MLEALLDISRLDAGGLEPNRTVFPIERLLKRLETTFTEAAREVGRAVYPEMEATLLFIAMLV